MDPKLETESVRFDAEFDLYTNQFTVKVYIDQVLRTTERFNTTAEYCDYLMKNFNIK